MRVTVTAKRLCLWVRMCVCFFSKWNESISLRKCVQRRPSLRIDLCIDCQFARSPLFIYSFLFRIKVRNVRGWERAEGLGGHLNQADMTYCPAPDERVVAGVVIVKDRHGCDTATQLLFCFLLLLCFKIVFVCSSDSHIKKKNKQKKKTNERKKSNRQPTNAPLSLQVGPSNSFMHDKLLL